MRLDVNYFITSLNAIANYIKGKITIKGALKPTRAHGPQRSLSTLAHEMPLLVPGSFRLSPPSQLFTARHHFTSYPNFLLLPERSLISLFPSSLSVSHTSLDTSIGNGFRWVLLYSYIYLFLLRVKIRSNGLLGGEETRWISKNLGFWISVFYFPFWGWNKRGNASFEGKIENDSIK